MEKKTKNSDENNLCKYSKVQPSLGTEREDEREDDPRKGLRNEGSRQKSLG